MPRYGRLGLPLYEAIYSMRAIRRMRPDPLPDEDLEIILDAARQAPNGGNAQPWHFIVVRNPQLKSELGALYHEAWWAKRADEGIEGPDHPAFENPVRRSAMRLADEIGEAPVMILLCATAQGAGPRTRSFRQSRICCSPREASASAAPSRRCTRSSTNASKRCSRSPTKPRSSTASRSAIREAASARSTASRCATSSPRTSGARRRTGCRSRGPGSTLRSGWRPPARRSRRQRAVRALALPILVGIEEAVLDRLLVLIDRALLGRGRQRQVGGGPRSGAVVQPVRRRT